MGLANLGRDTINAIGESGKTMWDTTKNFSWKNPNATEYVAKPAGMVERATSGYLKGFVGKPLGWGLKVADVTAAFVLTPVKWLAKAPGAYFKAFPRLAPISVVLGSAAAIGSYFTHRKSEAKQDHYAAQMGAIQARMAATQSSPYMNSVTPEDMAAMEARMAIDKAQGTASASHVAGVEAARQAASAQNAQQQPVPTSVA